MLDLFEKVEVKKTDRLNGEDLSIIKNLQNKFDNDKLIFERLTNHIEIFKDTQTNEYFGFTELQSNFRSKLKESTKKFICDVYSHFSSKYTVGLDYVLWDENKFRWNMYSNATTWEKSFEYVNSINYEVILDSIYSQLGTLDFLNKGKQEFLDSVKNKLGYKLGHKNNKISYSGVVYVDDWDATRINWGYSTENLAMIFKSINLFENDNYSLSPWADDFIEKCRGQKRENEFFDTFTTHTKNIPYGEIEHIKIFKNGKVELKFEDYETAKKYYDMFFKESRY